MVLDLLKNKKLLMGVLLGLILSWVFLKMCSKSGRCMIMQQQHPIITGESECYPFEIGDNICQFPENPSEPAYIPAAYYQDEGYGSGTGSIGAVEEGFNAECLGRDPIGTEYPSANMMPYQVACQPEPVWNLPRDARMEHQAMYPCGVPNQQNSATCQRRHPMDSVYSPPNEGIMTRQVRN